MASKNSSLDGLARWALDVQLTPLRKLVKPKRPQRGWIKAIRESLGMTTGQFAQRLGVAQPRVVALERAEANEVATLKTLRQAAEALDCEFIYAIVPRVSLDEMARARALKIADQQLARADQTMRLENQGVSRKRMERAREDLAAELLRGDRRLWSDL